MKFKDSGFLNVRSAVLIAVTSFFCLALAGCGAGFSPSSTGSAATAAMAFTGSVHGGQQPVSGAKIFLYAASTASTGGAAQSLLNAPGYVTSDGNGNFTITGDYACPSGANVYMLALGGNPGLATGTNNAQIGLAASLGACANLTPSTFITINEVTTVAAAYALAPIATTETQIGSASSSTLTGAFATAANYANFSTGLANTRTPTGNGVVPQSKLDSLADALASCINSDGTGTPCQNLMSAANLSAGSGLPFDTFQAALSIADQPTVNVSTIFNLIGSSVPFNPSLSSSPSDWTLPILYPGQAGYPGQVSVALAPAQSTLTQSAQQVLTAGVSNATALSYMWTASGAAGTLTETGGLGRTGQTSYCSTSGQARFVPNAAPMLAAKTNASVSVQAFSTPACLTGTALGNASSAITLAPAYSGTVPTLTKTMTVQLPSGSKLTPDQVLVVDSVGEATPSSTGTFTLPLFSEGEQIAMVLSPNGNPMLMGWMDAAHTTLSAETTAEVYAYFVSGGNMLLNESDRNKVISQIPSLPGTATLTQVISNELASNPDAFGQSDAALSNALDAFFKSISGGITPYVKVGKAKAEDVIGTPSASTTQSGVSLTTQNPFAFTLSNGYRRRSHYFLIHQKDTLNGQDTVVNQPVQDADLDPASGLSSGVTGAFSDIFNSYFGNQPSAYTPVTSDPISAPLTSGYDSSTYQVINIGPGGLPPAVPLTSAQQNQLFITSVNDFVLDAIVPLIGNAVIGSGVLPDAGNSSVSTGATNVRSEFVTRLETDFLSFLGNVPGEQSKIASGDYKGAVNDLFNGLETTETQNAILDALKYCGATTDTDVEGTPAGVVAKTFEKAVGVAGAVLQIFDSTVLAVQIGASDQADVWTVKVVPTKAALSPQNPVLHGYNFVTLTATVPSVGDTTGYSFQWSIAPAAGQSLIGNLNPNDGSGRSAQTSTFCSSANNVNYDNTLSAVQNLSNNTSVGTDTVSVTVFTGSGCKSTSQLTQTVSTTVTTQPSPGVTVLPYNGTINPGGSAALTATYSDTSVTPQSYQWSLQAGASGTASGTLNSSDGTGINSFCSTSPNATYISTVTGQLNGNVTDGVTVSAYSGTGCASGSNSQQLGTSGTAMVTTTSSPLLIVGPSVTINPGQSVQVGAAFSAYATGNPTVGSYLWTSTNTYGTLSGGTSFCSTSSDQTYTAAANASLSQTVQDIVTATPYSDSSCTQQVGIKGTAYMNIEPAAGPFVAPAPISNVLQSGDGNFYATATTATCGPNNSDSCDYILRIDPEGTVTTLHTFYVNQNTNTCQKSVTGVCTNTEGSQLNGLIETSDGSLWGSAKQGGNNANGTVFTMARDGTVTVQYDFPNGTLSGNTPHVGNIVTGPYDPTARAQLYCCSGCASGSPGPTYTPATGQAPSQLIEGSDGYIYGTAIGGIAYGNYASGVFFRFSPAGDFNLLRVLTYQVAVVSGSYTYGACGSVHTAPSYTYVNVDPVYFTYGNYYGFGGGYAPPLVQAADGNFYGQTTGILNSGSGPTNSSRIFRLTPSGTPTDVYDDQGNSPGTSALIAAPSGLLYGADSGSLFSISTAGTFNVVASANGSTAPVLTVLGSDGNFYGFPNAYASTNFSQITPAGAVTTLGPVTDSDPNANIQNSSAGTSMIETSNGRLVGNASGTAASGGTVYYLYNDQVSSTLKGPIQLSFASATAPVNRPVTLTWKVSNAFSLTAQQCHATVLDHATGAGNWSGAQVGTLINGVYTGSLDLVPTAPGNYTYALTCGGRESGFTTLNVQ